MITQMFLKLDPIKGESLASYHEDEIELLDFKWAVAHDVDRSGKDEDAKKISPKFADVTLKKVCDKASPILIKFFTLGNKIDKGILTFRKNDGDENIIYLLIEMSEVRVTSFDWGVDEEGQVYEEIGLNMAKFMATYSRQSNDGIPAGYIDFGFEIDSHATTGRERETLLY